MGCSSLRHMCINNQWLRSRRGRWKFEVLLGLAVLSLLTLFFSRQLYDGSKVPKHPTLRVSHRRRRSDEVTYAQMTLALSMLCQLSRATEMTFLSGASVLLLLREG